MTGAISYFVKKGKNFLIKKTRIQAIIDDNNNLRYQNELILKKLARYEKDKNYGWPNGHYYSPVHDKRDLKEYPKVKHRSIENYSKSIPGFNEKKILEEYKELKKYFKDFDYPKKDDGKNRFYSSNVSLSLLDSMGIFSIIRKYKPKKIIEIGSGFSSALMMEINQKYFKNKIDLTFIEPNPDLLYSRMSDQDIKKHKVIPKAVQDVTLSEFTKLSAGDILFIDSTHVSKFNSDVNYEIFNILPILAKGVIIHIHDIHHGFEYALDWLEKGWAWNEVYLLRAFLMHNNDYEVMLANSFLENNHSKQIKNLYSDQDRMYNNFGEEIIRHSGSIWIRKA